MRRYKNKLIQKDHEVSTRIPVSQIDSHLSELPLLERITETIRYTMSRLECSISPTGSIWRWFFYWLKVGLGIVVPAMILLPILLLAANAILSLTETLIQILMNLGFILLPLVIVGVGVYWLLGVFKK